MSDETAVKEFHPTETVIFKEGEAAGHFYVLLDGRVRISIGESGSGQFMSDNIAR